MNGIVAAGIDKYEGREVLVVHNWGYYEKDGVWYGPCCSVVFWKKDNKEE